MDTASSAHHQNTMAIYSQIFFCFDFFLLHLSFLCVSEIYRKRNNVCALCQIKLEEWEEKIGISLISARAARAHIAHTPNDVHNLFNAEHESKYDLLRWWRRWWWRRNHGRTNTIRRRCDKTASAFVRALHNQEKCTRNISSFIFCVN